MQFCRCIAVQESHALRGYARWGVKPPPSPPIDYFHLFTTQKGRP